MATIDANLVGSVGAAVTAATALTPYVAVVGKASHANTGTLDFITVGGTESLEGIDVDLSSTPDVAQTLAVVALFAKGETTIHGLHTLRVKETDRLAALSVELKKLGAEVEIDGDDALTIHPPERGLKPAVIETYDDHRMAMSFAVAGTRSAGVTIREVECVNKTYPRFFDDLSRLRAPAQ